MRPCAAEHETPAPAECRLCWLYETDPGYRALWGGPPLRGAGKPRLNLAELAGQKRH